MRIPSEYQALHQVRDILSDLLGFPSQDISMDGKRGSPPDAILRAGHHTLAVEWKAAGTVGRVSSAAEQARHAAADLGDSVIPLVAVPYMGEAAREYCEQADVAWLDLSGNARIFAPGLRVHLIGNRNRFVRLGRPESAFAPKASRVARWLLTHPMNAISQRDIASATGLDEGHTSRVVRKLIDDELVVREEGGIRARDPDLLLDAWREEYRFDKHAIVKGHISARSGEDLVRRIDQVLGSQNVPYAITGLGAAWLLTRHAGFRLATAYVTDAPSDLLSALAFREEPRGANTWLVIPNDEGVLQGVGEREGVRCVHPVQAYLDLKAQPERADEAAMELRNRHLRWSEDDR